MNNMEQKKLVLAIQWHVRDDWYGKNYRIIFKGFDDNGFRTKTEAKKHLSMLKKFAFFKYGNSDIEFSKKYNIIEIDEYKNLETYRYYSMGPSWSCTNISVDVNEFKEFVESEKIRLKK